MKKLIMQYAKDLIGGRLASGFEHSYRIYHLAREIAEGEQYDDDVLHAACFLHNIEPSIENAGQSAERAAVILTETGFDSGKIRQVTDAIAEYPPAGSPQSIEGKLLHDADLLDNTGAIGVVRLAIGAYSWYQSRTMEEVHEVLTQWLEYADTFFFERAREMSREKITFMQTAIDQLAKELQL